MELALVVSDNTAADILLREAGGPARAVLLVERDTLCTK